MQDTGTHHLNMLFLAVKILMDHLDPKSGNTNVIFIIQTVQKFKKIGCGSIIKVKELGWYGKLTAEIYIIIQSWQWFIFLKNGGWLTRKSTDWDRMLLQWECTDWLFSYHQLEKFFQEVASLNVLSNWRFLHIRVYSQILIQHILGCLQQQNQISNLTVFWCI